MHDSHGCAPARRRVKVRGHSYRLLFRRREVAAARVSLPAHLCKRDGGARSDVERLDEPVHLNVHECVQRVEGVRAKPPRLVAKPESELRVQERSGMQFGAALRVQRRAD
eukprot:6195263-Pleurochrysis_carterae.AAC.2